MPPSECPPWSSPDSNSQLIHVVRGMGDFHRFTLKNARTRILDHGDIKSWHGRIFEKVVPKPYYAGYFRSDDPDRPCLRENVAVGSRPGAHFKDVPDLMREFSSRLTKEAKIVDRHMETASDINKTRAVLRLTTFAFGRLVQIHPFLNGNGRMSRLTGNYFLHRYGYRLLFETPYPRPGGQYENASAACMDADYRLMYQYLVETLAEG